MAKETIKSSIFFFKVTLNNDFTIKKIEFNFNNSMFLIITVTIIRT